MTSTAASQQERTACAAARAGPGARLRDGDLAYHVDIQLAPDVVQRRVRERAHAHVHACAPAGRARMLAAKFGPCASLVQPRLTTSHASPAAQQIFHVTFACLHATARASLPAEPRHRGVPALLISASSLRPLVRARTSAAAEAMAFVSVTSNTSGEKKSPSSDASASASATLRTLRAAGNSN